MFGYSRRVLKDEALKNASQTLEATVMQVDNILLSVEQSAGNMYWDMLQHLDNPDRMFVYSRKLVETNPYIVGAAIAMEPYYYKEHGQYFMAYVHRIHGGRLATTDAPVIQATTFGNVPYTEQVWYTKALETGRPCWINPLKDSDTEDGEAIITFSLPIYDRQRGKAGVLAVDISLEQLSGVVLAAKPSPNSYATVLAGDGSYVVHPDSTRLFHQTAFERKDADATVVQAVRDMVAGKTGYQKIRMEGADWYVFYKPFRQAAVTGRSMVPLGWSAGIVYPEDDIFDDYNQLQDIVWGVSVAGLLVLLVLCWAVTHRQLLPLRMLTTSAQRIADGHYDETIPDSRQQDEIGRLQDHFRQMQQSLASHVSELQRLTGSLEEQGKVLSEAYEQAREADRVKTAFLHNMTNQMLAPVGFIDADVQTLCDCGQQMEHEKVVRLVDDIDLQGRTVVNLLGDMLDASQKKEGIVTDDKAS